MAREHKHWKYKNTTLLLISVVVFIYFADSLLVKQFADGLGQLGYLGAFITGIFLISTFTVAPAAVVLFYLADHLNPLEVAILAGLGGVIGDYLIFRFFKDKVFSELQPLFKGLGKTHFATILRTPYFGWLMPVVGAAILASPFPDELGIAILGLSKLKSWQFLILSFILNTFGILIIVTLARSI